MGRSLPAHQGCILAVGNRSGRSRVPGRQETEGRLGQVGLRLEPRCPLRVGPCLPDPKPNTWMEGFGLVIRTKARVIADLPSQATVRLVR